MFEAEITEIGVLYKARIADTQENGYTLEFVLNGTKNGRPRWMSLIETTPATVTSTIELGPRGVIALSEQEDGLTKSHWHDYVQTYPDGRETEFEANFRPQGSQITDLNDIRKTVFVPTRHADTFLAILREASDIIKVL